MPSTQVPTSSSPPRPTIKTGLSTAIIEENQSSEFLGGDKVTFTSLKESFNHRESLPNIVIL